MWYVVQVKSGEEQELTAQDYCFKSCNTRHFCEDRIMGV